MLMDCDLLDKSSNPTELPLAADHCQNIFCTSEELIPRRYFQCTHHYAQIIYINGQAMRYRKSREPIILFDELTHHGLRMNFSAQHYG